MSDNSANLNNSSFAAIQQEHSYSKGFQDDMVDRSENIHSHGSSTSSSRNLSNKFATSALSSNMLQSFNMSGKRHAENRSLPALKKINMISVNLPSQRFIKGSSALKNTSSALDMSNYRSSGRFGNFFKTKKSTDSKTNPNNSNSKKLAENSHASLSVKSSSIKEKSKERIRSLANFKSSKENSSRQKCLQSTSGFNKPTDKIHVSNSSCSKIMNKQSSKIIPSCNELKQNSCTSYASNPKEKEFTRFSQESLKQLKQSTHLKPKQRVSKKKSSQNKSPGKYKHCIIICSTFV